MMMKQRALGATLAALLGACGGGTSSNQTQTGSNAQASANMAHGSMPNGPFAEVDMRMHERMAAAVGANASETWTRKMIEHHRGAVEMSQLLIDRGGDPQMVRMARQTIEKQQREIAEMERTLAGGISGGSGEANPFGAVEQNMHRQMMAATGTGLSETWARKMIAHHQGAVDMSELLVRQGGDPQVLIMARRTAQDQGREIAHLEAMLRGEASSAPQAAAVTAAPAAPAKADSRDTAEPAARQPNAAPEATPAPRPAQRNQAAPRPAPTPDPAPAPKTTCTPEHAAMGHC